MSVQLYCTVHWSNAVNHHYYNWQVTRQCIQNIIEEKLKVAFKLENIEKVVLKLGLPLFCLLIYLNTTECLVKILVSDQVSHPHKTTNNITVLNISIFIFNKISVPNNNLLQKGTFDRLSRWLPQTKHFSPCEILTSLAPIYRTNI